MQAKYCSLRSDSPNVAKGGKPLPTLDQLEGKLRLAKKVTLRDVWGLMLCQVPSKFSTLSIKLMLLNYWLNGMKGQNQPLECLNENGSPGMAVLASHASSV